MRIAAVGEVAEDEYLPEGDVHLGGISANFARAARRAGAAVSLYAPIGDDERGRRLLAALSAAALAQHVRTVAGRSACQKLRVAADGERQFCGFDAGVLVDYELGAAELEELARHDAVALPCAPESRRVFAQCCAQLPASLRLVADFSQDSAAGDDPAAWIRPHTARLTAAFVGGTRSFREPLRRLAADTGLLIVLTAGRDGAYAFTPGDERSGPTPSNSAWGSGAPLPINRAAPRQVTELHQPSLAASVRDTTGCGDAFQGGFVASWLGGAPIDAALRTGAELAADVAARRGAG